MVDPVKSSGQINWAVILNIALLAMVILGAWFSTFSNPLNEKFLSLEKTFQAQITAQEKMQALTAQSVERINKEIEESVARRFAVQDKANDEIVKAHRSLVDDIERRRVEVATKSELQSVFGTTRLEFLAEIKRVDEHAKRLDTLMLPRGEFDVWRLARTQAYADIEQRIRGLELAVRDHERDDRRAAPLPVWPSVKP